jgi:molybdopterin-synthase adenylyltransferase
MSGSVLVVGVGGLGSPAALVLASAGKQTIQRVGLVDPDTVELSNLQRQIIHATPDLGHAKVASARAKLICLNPRLEVETHQERLHAGNLSRLFASYDFIIDGTDTVATKFLINDGAVLLGKPFSYGGIVRFQGQTLTVLPGRTTCLRCLFPTPPAADDIPSCQEAGIVGSIAGSVGMIQAAEALRYLRDEGCLLTDRLLTYDAQALRWRTVAVRRNPRCPLCGQHPGITYLAPPEQEAADRSPC